MGQKIRQFLWISLVCILILCIGVFTWITLYMIDENDKTISEVGEIYMSEMGQQISLHFSTLIDLYQSKLKGIVWSSQQEEHADTAQLQEKLATSAQNLGFSYLGLYAGDGSCQVLYGEPVQINEEGVFMDALDRGEPRITDGTGQSGDTLLLLGTTASYPMENGDHSTVLVAGLPMQMLSDILSLNIGATNVYSDIIRSDGSYIWKISDSPEGSYFNRILSYDDFGKKPPEEACKEISAAMEARENYSLVMHQDGESHNTHFTPLAYSDWYLASILPYELLHEPTSRLLNQRIFTAISGCIIILSVMLFVYYKFFRMSRQQMALLNEARQEAESANRAKSTFLSNMSHDIRTPMNAIMGMTAIASTSLDNPAQLQDCLKKITLSSKHLLGLINDVLDMSKIESGKMSLNMELLSLREVMDGIAHIVQPQVKNKKQTFDIFIEQIQTEQVYCDGTRLNQVLLNLLSNAIKFTPEGGTIHVMLSQENSPLGASYVRNHFRVKDSGIGMSPEFQKNIFDSFAREDTKRVNKIEGTGLGMAITKYIVDEMKGVIELQSEVDRGTEFHVILDLERSTDKEEDMILPNWEMLIVDDDEQLCHSAVSSLKEIGVQADCAFSGKAAVDMTLKRHQENRGYQIVLLDWKMPGMDGIETAREIRKHVGEDVPIILISAYDWGGIEKEARAAGINGFLSKPLFKSTLFYGLKPFTQACISEPKLPQEQQRSYTGVRILLAEDHDINWEIANRLLTSRGFIVERAENGKDCVDQFLASAPGFYDVILMDIRMPIMDGYEATKAIRASGRPDSNIPIIAVTADAFDEDIRQSVACGMNAHIAKPIDFLELSKVLSRYLNNENASE